MGKQSPLFAQHQAMGGKMVEFGGWDMPLHYGSQIDEHHQVRRHAGMFDVSHMTLVDIQGIHAKPYLQYLLANDVAKLDGRPGKALYTAMLNHEGGVVDDLIVYNRESANSCSYRAVVNCATRTKDLAWMAEIGRDYDITLEEQPDLAMIAVQGPQALRGVTRVLPAWAGAIDQLAPFEAFEAEGWFVARTGYTGEDGLEIMLPASAAGDFWQQLADDGIRPCGLGARDTLRLEAGLNLYGQEMDDTVSPLEANMGWTIAWKPEHRDFVGRQALLDQKAKGLSHKLVGVKLHQKGILRRGQQLRLAQDAAPDGIMTSGSFSPTLGLSIGLARVQVDAGDRAQVDRRGKWLEVELTRPNILRG